MKKRCTVQRFFFQFQYPSMSSLLPGKTQFLFFLLLFNTALICLSSSAQGDVQIYPKRILFDGSKRAQELSIANSGKDTARYTISVIQIRMKDDGSFETIDRPYEGQNFADKNFRFFPRTVVLAPNEAQTVKIQLLKFSELPGGEYRSHLYFRAEAEKKPLGQDSTGNKSSIEVRIVPTYGISIPVIIRSGEPSTEISVSQVQFSWEKDTIPVLNFDLNRSGNMSVYGDIKVDYLSTEGKETRVCSVKGMSLYAPNSVRHFRLPLQKRPDINFKKGSLHIVYTDVSGPVQKVAQQQIFLN
jgi:hypothetical protein